MTKTQTILSKLKACRKLAGGKAAGRHPRSASSFLTTLKGWRNSGGARLWSQTQPQRVAITERVGNFVRAAAGASHTAALRPSTGGARDVSPRREPWVIASGVSSSGRSDRTARPNHFLSPLRGLRQLHVEPTACAVGYHLAPFHGWEMAAQN
ncbi:MAG: hypothetical protein D4R57_01450 [Verrucomicrobiales bacterium]|nr:MAG: hypothetical protein D4R57_01450 [Verrucomicrobiales bacterium]